MENDGLFVRRIIFFSSSISLSCEHPYGRRLCIYLFRWIRHRCWTVKYETIAIFRASHVPVVCWPLIEKNGGEANLNRASTWWGPDWWTNRCWIVKLLSCGQCQSIIEEIYTRMHARLVRTCTQPYRRWSHRNERKTINNLCTGEVKKTQQQLKITK